MPKRTNLVGQKFTRLTVVEETAERRHRQIVYKCLCDCGNVVYATSNQLKTNNTRSCGCLHKESSSKRFPKKPINLTGKKFGKLTAIQPTPERFHGQVVWKCQCKCGQVEYVPMYYLTHGRTKECKKCRGL